MTDLDEAVERLEFHAEKRAGRALTHDIRTVLYALSEAASSFAAERADKYMAEDNAAHWREKHLEALAVIERAKDAIGDVNEWDGHGRADQLDNTRAALSTAPVDALRAVKAEAWDEGQQAEAEAQFQDAGYGNVQHPENPYREEQERD